MVKSLVTGVAGFIGSHLAEKLVAIGHHVIGVDCYTDYYTRQIKEANLNNLRDKKNFEFLPQNILELDLKKVLDGIDYIFHLAAQAGVRASWGVNFKIYADFNVMTTQKILEAAKDVSIKKLIFASSSSIYGDAESFPTEENAIPKPISPYGVTKLDGENLCYLYWKNYHIPVICLRLFTVYGPRQRPDMAFYKFIKSLLKDEEIVVYGDGQQSRDFTYISDVIEANILAMKENVAGEIFNIGVGTSISINDIITLLERIIEKKAKIKYLAEQKGDVKHTKASIDKAREILGYHPMVNIEDGLEKEVSWFKELQTKLPEII